MGIREHHLRLVEDSDLPNTFPCWVIDVAETPFNVNLFLRFKDHQDAVQSCQPLQFSISKEEYDMARTKPFPWLVQLRPEYLFLMK